MKPQKPQAGNSLQDCFPEIAKLWCKEKNDFSPSEITKSSSYKAWWNCEKCHYPSQCRVVDKVKNPHCPICSNKKIVAGFNDVATTHPEILNFWNDDKISPTTVSRMSAKKVCFKCSKGHAFVRPLKKFTGYCSECADNNTQYSEKNSLKILFPELELEYDKTLNDKNFNTLTYNSSYNAQWNCLINKNHSWKAPVYQRVNSNTGCRYCSIENHSSSSEEELKKFIQELLQGSSVEVLFNDRNTISPQELDIYIPSQHIAIEYNGLYWHSDFAGKDKNYHYSKWKKCFDNNIQLITIWEDQWLSNKDFVKRMLQHKLGLSAQFSLGARETNVVAVSYQDCCKFLEEYHIQKSASGSFYLGLTKKNSEELVAVSVWRKVGRNVYLDRFASKISVVGGLNKIIAFAKRNDFFTNVDQIITFADHCVSNGDLYEKTGFVQDKMLKPDYFYVVNRKRFHKFNYRLQRFKNDPSLKFVEGLSESQLAKLNHIARVYDCGKTKYVMKL